MSGHSKWSTIKRKKGAADEQRGKIFTKLGRELAVAVKEGGPDPISNWKLRDAIAKAKAGNMPNDTINRSIKKAAGEGSGENYEEIIYEGYGPSGVAVIVETLTGNRNRTAGDMRHYFDKYGGNLGQTGSVAFMFERCGVIIIEKTDKLDEDTVMMDALDAGASDFEAQEECYSVTTAVPAFGAVREYLEKRGYEFAQAEIEYVPQTMVKLTNDEDVKNMNKLIDHLEDNDDVQSVFHNWEEEV